MSVRELVLDHTADRRKLARGVELEARRLWRGVGTADLGSWLGLLGRLLVVLVAAQRAAAQRSDAYLDAVLAEQGIQPDAAGAVAAATLSGVASDGRPLGSLLWSPVVAARRAIAEGASAPRAKAHGWASLDMIVRTQVADAGRVADSVAMTARPGIAGYERVVHLPACGRCIVLAGRLYRWSQGFERHPRCDCTMEPVTREQWREERPENTPGRLFEQMTLEQRDKAFTRAGAQAISDGADLSQVVNARRGMSTAAGSDRRRQATERVFGQDVFTTREGVTRRGIAGARLITGDPNAFTAPRTGGNTTVVSQHTRLTGRGGRQVVRLRGARTARLMPESIYQLATSREDAVRLLRLHGYIL
ncbi:MAG TPA: hypothetical protein VJT49_14770 [Amycolatopsis sp.]|uniref:hypothetical protein n=1 Tax=Amycolatopsis sp. TaxID=37632 RepID=UPI002B48C40B|nr:hypothetical protein [Amycolatopsis sp.]HKS46341.1 hypothetical protein [Amycolatopsis sp.]